MKTVAGVRGCVVVPKFHDSGKAGWKDEYEVERPNAWQIEGHGFDERSTNGVIVSRAYEKVVLSVMCSAKPAISRTAFVACVQRSWARVYFLGLALLLLFPFSPF
jgi:hypothetical protein